MCKLVRCWALCALGVAPWAFADTRVDAAPQLRQELRAAQPGTTVRLAAGEYWVAVDVTGVALEIPAGVTLDARGTTIRLIENDLRGYYVIAMPGNDSHLIGGTIVGDRDRHLGKLGEWGMCVGVRGASNVTIRGTKVQNCWGDGIYVGTAGDSNRPSRDVKIQDVEATNNRRNNISIVSAIGFQLSNIRASRANGHPPQAGIDLEPNGGDRVIDGVLSDIVVANNEGRGLVFAGSEGEIRNIRMDRIRATGNAGAGFWLKAATGVRGTTLVATGNGWHGMMLTRVQDFNLSDYSGVRNWQLSAGVPDISIVGSDRVHLEKSSSNGVPVTGKSPQISFRKSTELTFK